MATTTAIKIPKHTYADAARELGYTEEHVRRLVHLERLSHTKIGGRVRFSDEDLAAFVRHIPASPAIVAPAHGRRAKRARGKQ